MVNTVHYPNTPTINFKVDRHHKAGLNAARILVDFFGAQRSNFIDHVAVREHCQIAVSSSLPLAFETKFGRVAR